MTQGKDVIDLSTPAVYFLETAKVQVNDNSGVSFVCRALVDPGAQRNILVIPDEVKQTTNLQTFPLREELRILGVGNEVTIFKEEAVITLHPSRGSGGRGIRIRALVSPQDKPWYVKMPHPLPKEIHRLKNELADPDILLSTTFLPFHLILGNAPSHEITTGCDQKRRCGSLYVIPTLFGSVIGGRLQLHKKNLSEDDRDDCSPSMLSAFKAVEVFEEEKNIIRHLDRQQMTERFHILGDIDYDEKLQQREKEFLEDYLQQIERTEEGRVAMSFPRNPNFRGILSDNHDLCDSVSQLQLRYEQTDPEKAQAYKEIFEGWKRDGVIERITEEEMAEKLHVELPHHLVTKESSTSTKHRCVLNGAAKEPGKASVGNVDR